MRTLAGLVLAIIMTLAAAPTQAQTYDPNYPICLQTFGRAGNYISCGYTSMDQCRLSASGRAAQCITNPSAYAVPLIDITIAPAQATDIFDGTTWTPTTKAALATVALNIPGDAQTNYFSIVLGCGAHFDLFSSHN